MIHLLVLIRIFLLVAYSNLLLAQDTTFINPPPPGANLDFTQNPVISVNSQVQLAWVTNVNAYSIWLWQQTGGGFVSASTGSQIYTKADGQTEAGGTLWQVTTEKFLLSASNVFFVALGPFANLTDASTSHYFNITTGVVTTSSTLASSSTSTSTNTPSSSAAAPSSSTATTTPAATSSAAAHQGSDSSSGATTVGLGVGLGVGIPAILLLSAVLYLIIRKTKRANSANNDLPAYGNEHSQSSDPMVYDKGGRYELPVEMMSPSGR